MIEMRHWPQDAVGCVIVAIEFVSYGRARAIEKVVSVAHYRIRLARS